MSHPFDRHEGGFVRISLRRGNVFVDCFHQFQDRFFADVVSLSLKGASGAADDNGRLFGVVSVFSQQLANLHLHQLDHLLVGGISLKLREN